MSAVMSTLSIISGGRRGGKKPLKNLKSLNRKSGQFSDSGDGGLCNRDSVIQRRSTSMQTLENAGAMENPVTQGQLDHLEAKMACIEVSLSTNSRRRRPPNGVVGNSTNKIVTRDLDTLRNALREKDALIQSLKEQLSTTLSITRMSATLSEQNGAGGTVCVLSPEERKKLDDRACAARQRVVEKRQTIAGIKLALDSLHVTENIDSRIQQAELEYALGREELELLTLMEQARALQTLLEQADTAARSSHTLYGCMKEAGGSGTMHAVEINMETACPRLCSGGGRLGIRVESAREHSGLQPGDRLIEVDGKSVWSCRNPTELPRVSGSVQMVVMRCAKHENGWESSHPTSAALTQVVTLRAELDSLRQHSQDTKKVKETLKADNLRLTHRISYLEEQVAELIAKSAQNEKTNKQPSEDDINNEMATVNNTKKNVTNISIRSETPDKTQPNKPDVQVFQKGPDVTAIVSNLPGLEAGAKNTAEASANLPVLRPKSNMSNVSSIAIHSPRPGRSRSIASAEENENTPNKNRPQRSSRQSLDYALQLSKSTHHLDKEKYESIANRKSHKIRQSLSHHCISGKLDYQAETAAALEIIKQNQKHYLGSPLQRLEHCRSTDNFNSKFASNIDFYDNTSFSDIYSKTDNEISPTKKTSWAERKTFSIIEQLKQSQRLRKAKSKNKSVEHIDFEPESYDRIDGKVLETHNSSRKTTKLCSRNAKHSDFESENSDYPVLKNSYTDYASEVGAFKLGLKQSQSMMNVLEAKPRPMPPKKPLRLSLHKAQSSHSVNSDRTLPDILDGSTVDIYRNIDDQRKPSKRNHKGDRFPPEIPTKSPSSREKLNTLFNRSNQATPTPTKKFQDNAYQAYHTPGADDLYPDSPKMLNHHQDATTRLSQESPRNHDSPTRRYSPRTPSGTDSIGSRTPSRAESNHSSKWPQTPNRSPNEQYTSRYNGHTSDGGKWC